MGKRARWLGLILGLIVLLLALWSGYLLADVYTYSFESDPAPADAAIVLGTEAWGDEPSPVFEERIKHAILLYQAGTVRAIVFTGGVGEGDRLAESQVARAYAIQRGVPAGNIYCETASHFTHENLAEAARIVEAQGLGRVLVVSDPLHMRRAVVMARDFGLDAHPSPTTTSRYRSWHSKLGFLVREAFFYGAYLLSRPVMNAV